METSEVEPDSRALRQGQGTTYEFSCLEAARIPNSSVFSVSLWSVLKTGSLEGYGQTNRGSVSTISPGSVLDSYRPSVITIGLG